MNNKKGFEFSFGWLFSIIIGIAFISMAIYASSSLLDFGKASDAAFAAKEFGILLNPVETGVDSGKTSTIAFRTNTRTYFECESTGNFGSQKISTSIESSIGNKWEAPGTKVSFNNKYIFSKSVVEGERIIALAKPLDMPYKVSDLLYIFSEEDVYCFTDTPSEIEKEMKGLAIKSVNISKTGACPRNSTKVCFSKTGCNIDVNLQAKTVKKYKRTLYYSADSNNALIYAAIFADPGIYECQVKRLMKRNSALGELYFSKALSLSSSGCNSNLEYELSLFSNSTASFNSSIDIRTIQYQADEMERRNNNLDCKLF